MSPTFAARLAALLSLAPFAAAQSFQFTLEPNLSATNLGGSFEIDLPSTGIGDFDAVNNPAGTSTCTSLFGACNNTAIAFTNSLEIDSSFAGSPSGTFVASIDTAAGVAVISGFAAAPLGKDLGVADLTLNLLYTTFRTTQPTSLFVGGINLPLPLGQATVDNLLFEQTGDVAGVLTPTAIADVFDFTAVLPTTLSFDFELLGNPTQVGPLPFPLPVVGTLDLRNGGALLSFTVDASGKQTIPDPLGGQTFEDLAFPLPTVLPPGGVANLLFDITPGDLDLVFLTDLDWTAIGAGVCDAASYCVTTPNTFSAGAQIQAGGSNSIAFNDFTLLAGGVPPGHAGRFAMSRLQTQLPFGDGTLCLGGVVRRYPLVFADASGLASYTVDFTDTTQPGALLSAGTTWNFQLIFRDPLGGPVTFNTSDAMSVTFCP
jgi:hypothetical protein